MKSYISNSNQDMGQHMYILINICINYSYTIGTLHQPLKTVTFGLKKTVLPYITSASACWIFEKLSNYELCWSQNG